MSITTVSVSEACASLPDLLRRAETGEEIIIGDGDRPGVRLVPEPKPLPVAGKRQFGLHAGQIWVGPDFDDPLPEEIQRVFDGDGYMP